MKKNSKKGFTLVEIMIVVVIIENRKGWMQLA